MCTVYEMMTKAIEDSYNQGYDKGCADAKALYEKELKAIHEKGFYKLGYEDGYKSGLVDAWKCAKKVCEVFSSDRLLEILEILGIEKVLFDYPASEVISKIKEYEDSQKCEKCIHQYRDICKGCVDLFELVDKEEYLKCENEIKVGDEIISQEGNKLIITAMGGQEGDWCCIDKNGCTCVLRGKTIKEYNWHKTGRHSQEIAEILRKMKEGIDDGKD